MACSRNILFLGPYREWMKPFSNEGEIELFFSPEKKGRKVGRREEENKRRWAGGGQERATFLSSLLHIHIHCITELIV